MIRQSYISITLGRKGRNSNPSVRFEGFGGLIYNLVSLIKKIKICCPLPSKIQHPNMPKPPEKALLTTLNCVITKNCRKEVIQS